MTQETTGDAALPSPPTHSGTVGERMAKGAVWMVLARGVDRVIGLAGTVILARLLVPADFGMVAMATAILAMLELLGMFGFDAALIQNQQATRRHYDTAWTLNILLGCTIAAGLLLVAPLAASFYGEPRLANLVRWLAFAAFIQGFENIGVVAFRKELNFHKEFNLVSAKKLAMFLVTVPAALILRNYWALIIGIIVGRTASVVLTYLVQDYRPRLSLAARGDLFHFGKWMVLGSILHFLTTRSADFIIGRTAGPRQLGLFNLSYEIASLPTSDLVAPINRAIFPGYAKQASDRAVLKASYLGVTGLIGLLALPAGVGIAAIADLLVPLVLGEQWISAIPAVVILSLFGVLVAIKSNNHYVYMALGRPRLGTTLGAIQIVMLLPMLIFGSQHAGALGAAAAYLVSQALLTPISIGFLRRALSLHFRDLIWVLYRPALAAMLMYVVVRVLVVSLELQPDSGTPAQLLGLLTAVGSGVLTYVGAVYLLWSLAARPSGAETQVVEFAKAKLWPRLKGVAASR